MKSWVKTFSSWSPIAPSWTSGADLIVVKMDANGQNTDPKPYICRYCNITIELDGRPMIDVKKKHLSSREHLGTFERIRSANPFQRVIKPGFVMASPSPNLSKGVLQPARAPTPIVTQNGTTGSGPRQPLSPMQPLIEDKKEPPVIILGSDSSDDDNSVAVTEPIVETQEANDLPAQDPVPEIRDWTPDSSHAITAKNSGRKAARV